VRETLGTEERAALIEMFGETVIADDPPGFPGIWVRWQEVASLIDQNPDARVFTLDRRPGLVQFGDGRQGRIPPAGADNLRAFAYRAGGGQAGNVGEHTIISLKSSVTGVEAVTNPLPARGGSDGRNDQGSCDQATATVRHLNRAIATRDIESLALDFAPEIARARCLRPEAFDKPITVAITVASHEQGLKPSVAMQDGLEAFLRSKASSSWPEASFNVVGPEPVALSITIELSLVPNSPATLPLQIEDRLVAWLDPVTGGHDGWGWPFGRGLWPSDIHQALSGDLGGASIKALEITRQDGQGKPEAIGPIAIIAVARHDIEISLLEAVP